MITFNKPSTLQILTGRDEDPDPVGSVDFWAAGSGSVTFFTDPDPDPTCNNGYISLFSRKFLNKSENSYWWTAVTII